VIPDEEVRQTRSAILSGIDAPLTAALAWMASDTRSIPGRRADVIEQQR
jgi:hypothetical protein